MSVRPQLIVFAKAPFMGKAKTRLAADIGYVHAQRLYRAMTARVLRQVGDPRWDLKVAVSPDRALGQHPVWAGYTQTSQGTGSLSPRLVRAMSSCGPVCVIGTDCPEVTGSDIADAFAALRQTSHVMGKADDGGFWLIGARGPVGMDLFSDVAWSTETALADVAANAERAGGAVSYLRTLTDVDDLAALRSVRRRGAV